MMRPRARHNRIRPRVIFIRGRSNANAASANHSDSNMAAATAPPTDPMGHSPPVRGPSVPSLFTSGPPIRDALETDSSRLQDSTLDEVLPFLRGNQQPGAVNAHGIPHLDRRRHVNFLHKQLGKLPGAFTAADPSRPWIFYWCLAGLSLLGEDVAPYRRRLVDTVRTMQNEHGGFAGGFGQTSHLATTYATILSLTLVGGDEAYDVVDRRSMWRWVCSLKQPDGGFQMAVGGEEDVRYVCPIMSPFHHRPCRDTTLTVVPGERTVPLSLSRC